jgi:hypothetical protein
MGWSAHLRQLASNTSRLCDRCAVLQGPGHIVSRGSNGIGEGGVAYQTPRSVPDYLPFTNRTCIEVHFGLLDVRPSNNVSAI